MRGAGREPRVPEQSVLGTLQLSRTSSRRRWGGGCLAMSVAASLARLGSRTGLGFAVASGLPWRGAGPRRVETEPPRARGRADSACRGAGAGEGCDRRGRGARASPRGGWCGFARGRLATAQGCRSVSSSAALSRPRRAGERGSSAETSEVPLRDGPRWLGRVFCSSNLTTKNIYSLGRSRLLLRTPRASSKPLTDLLGKIIFGEALLFESCPIS